MASEPRPPLPPSASTVPVEDRRLHDAAAEKAFLLRFPRRPRRAGIRSLGLGLITGAADDDPSSIGTAAGAGAGFGTSFLWTAPVVFPMMFAIVYLCGKVGQVTGQGLFTVIGRNYSRWLLYFFLATALVGNVIEAGADMGGMAAAFNLFVPIPIRWIVVLVAVAIVVLQIFTSYETIRYIFRWLALSLFAYIGAAFLAHPDWRSVLRATVLPTIHFDKQHLSMLVALVGVSLSAYLFSWQSNVEVEEQISLGRRRSSDRDQAHTRNELRRARADIALGVFVSTLVIYFIMLSTAATLFKAGKTDISTAAQAAQTLRPVAGDAAGLLFVLGLVGVGFIALPVMTTGAAYDLCQTFGWNHGLHRKPAQAKGFYGAMVLFTVAAVALNFLGINPMKALVYAGIAQGVTTPFLTLIVLLITNNRRIMGPWTNRPAMNVLGGVTVIAMFAAFIGLIVTLVK